MEKIEGKNTAIIAYLTMLGALIALSFNNEPQHDFARFHTRQAFGLHLIFFAFAILISQWGGEYAFYGLYIFYVVLWGYGFTGAITGKKQEMPIVGPFFQKWFTFIK
ncbi:hypothetical protein H0I23_07090 [Cellulophaga sp. HaHaR_3_176]|uniref:hypothetical protein n=1 Tax=Cellulophaga sp. HaHaR_3_176 TaxID=1942464 RepID=UPI001C1F8847|nr:hypothetical protein [Cellulophaga sp. HaHaR_3_176]QWX85399.1 hypothetical protein H0I23_07090 [Cellulophaga sp. HaHaR_3_176]